MRVAILVLLVLVLGCAPRSQVVKKGNKAYHYDERGKVTQVDTFDENGKWVSSELHPTSIREVRFDEQQETQVHPDDFHVEISPDGSKATGTLRTRPRP